MSESKPIDVASEVTSQALVVREQGGAVEEAPKATMTPAQAKVDAIANLTMQAYQKAATLNLTPDESAALQADFPDEAFQPGAAGKEHLLYIEHAHLRDRFAQVFGMGQWAIIPRNRWAEPFRTAKGEDASRVYVEAMLVVRGCFVGEAIGAMEYYPKNASQNYGDAVEGAKTAAFRRCAKEFGVGLQAWKKDWCEGWWKRHWEAKRKPQNAPGRTEPVKHTTPTPAASPTPKSDTGQGNGTKYATQKHLARLVEALTPQCELAERFFRAIDWLLPTENLEALELAYVPISKEQFDLLGERLAACENGEPPVAPYPPNPRPLDPPKAKPEPKEPQSKPIEADPEWWRKIIVPIPHKDQKRDDYLKNPETIGGLYELRHGTDDLAQEARQRLWGFINHYEAKPWIGKDGKERPPSATDLKFREALDACAEWHKNNHPDEKL